MVHSWSLSVQNTKDTLVYIPDRAGSDGGDCPFTGRTTLGRALAGDRFRVSYYGTGEASASIGGVPVHDGDEIVASGPDEEVMFSLRSYCQPNNAGLCVGSGLEFRLTYLSGPTQAAKRRRRLQEAQDYLSELQYPE